METELASSKDMVGDLELWVMGLEEDLAKKEEELTRLEEKAARSVSEVICL